MWTWTTLGLVTVAFLARVTVATTCTRSFDCQAGHCCRDSQGNPLVDTEGSWGGMPILGQGHCAVGGAGPGETCDSTCRCPDGYECYRMVSGACCPPSRCITKAQADADRDYWRCRPPPPAPPPGNTGLDRSARRERRYLFSSLCPELPMVANPGAAAP